MPNGRSLCLDVGANAASALRSAIRKAWLASPLVVVERREAPARFRSDRRARPGAGGERVVVGLPRTLDGDIGLQARAAQRWTGQLQPHLAVPIVYWDERYSTAE